jgi:hypothetical protein
VKILKIKLIFLMIIILLCGCKNDKALNEEIMKTIDKKCKQSNSCKIDMKEITDFKWDKMLIFDLGSNRNEISEALGVEYTESADLMYGMVFVFENKIVYDERLGYNPEKPEKIFYNLGDNSSYKIYTADNAILKGEKDGEAGKYDYYIGPFEEDE